MKEVRERLEGESAVKATLLSAHLSWFREHGPDELAALVERVGEESRAYLERRLAATSWVPFRCLVEIDRAMSDLVGGDPEETYHELGLYSARINLAGVYKAFVGDEPHRFFKQMELLHRQFQSYGRSVYEQRGERSGVIRLEECDVFSRVFCGSSLGYYEGALEMMRVPGPVQGVESLCLCRGDDCCQFELAW